MEIQGLYNDDIQYYYLNSERSIICNTGEEKYCHALLYINHNYYSEKNLIYALPIKYNEEVTIYGDITVARDIEGKSYKDSIQNFFPTDQYYDQYSKNNMLFFDYSIFYEKNDLYIFLTIYSKNKNSQIKLITSSFDSSKILLPHQTEKLILLKENIEFYLPYDFQNFLYQNYTIDIKTLINTQKLIINDEENELKGKYYTEVKSYPFIK